MHPASTWFTAVNSWEDQLIPVAQLWRSLISVPTHNLAERGGLWQGAEVIENCGLVFRLQPSLPSVYLLFEEGPCTVLVSNVCVCDWFCFVFSV